MVFINAIEKVSWDQINKYIDEGLLTKRKHPRKDLFILNYTAKTQYEKLWDGNIEHYRGLIVDVKGNVMEKPFYKIFNFQEIENPFTRMQGKTTLFEKMDGSLGILYEDESTDFGFALATRGSFTSEQALKGTELLQYYCKVGFSPNKEFTYLFEIIYPENRIVVDYDNQEKLIFLGKIHTRDGFFVPSEHCSEKEYFPIPESIKLDDIHKCPEIPRNAEGYVFALDDGTLVKLKGEEYVRLHSILTGITEKSIWTMLKDGVYEKTLREMAIPDEMFEWMKGVSKDLRSQYQGHWNASLALSKEAIRVSRVIISSGGIYALKDVLRLHGLIKMEIKNYIDSQNTWHIVKQVSFLIAQGKKKDAEQALWLHLKPKKLTTYLQNNEEN